MHTLTVFIYGMAFLFKISGMRDEGTIFSPIENIFSSHWLILLSIMTEDIKNKTKKIIRLESDAQS